MSAVGETWDGTRTAISNNGKDKESVAWNIAKYEGTGENGHRDLAPIPEAVVVEYHIYFTHELVTANR